MDGMALAPFKEMCSVIFPFYGELGAKVIQRGARSRLLHPRGIALIVNHANVFIVSCYLRTKQKTTCHTINFLIVSVVLNPLYII
jgi:hypothetical protein